MSVALRTSADFAVEEARRVDRELEVREITSDWGPAIVRSAQEAGCDLIILPTPGRGALGLAVDIGFVEAEGVEAAAERQQLEHGGVLQILERKGSVTVEVKR